MTHTSYNFPQALALYKEHMALVVTQHSKTYTEQYMCWMSAYLQKSAQVVSATKILQQNLLCADNMHVADSYCSLVSWCSDKMGYTQLFVTNVWMIYDYTSVHRHNHLICKLIIIPLAIIGNTSY